VVLCFPDRQASTLTIETNKLVLGVLLLDLPGTKQSGVEVNVKDILFFFLDEAGYVDSLGQEHVVTV
jgi:hypothetical protein